MTDHENREGREGKTFDTLSHKVIGCAIEVHKSLGPGLLESTYQKCLSHELSINQIEHVCEAPLAIEYKGLELDCGYRVDILFPGQLILELKSVKELDPIHEAQLLTYLKLSQIPIGILLNFNVTQLKSGHRRLSVELLPFSS